MSSLDEVLQAARANPERAVFISRNGTSPQPELAIWIAVRLQAHGYIPILQDLHFKNTNFMLAMDAALATGARVLALLSKEYCDSQNCMTEALSALDDPRNSTGRLIILNLDDSSPRGLLRYLDRIAYRPVWRPGNELEMDSVLIAALGGVRSVEARFVLRSEMDASQIVHAQVLMHDETAFTGRDRELDALRDLLWNGGTAALTRAGAKGLFDEATLAGMGGVGKTTLARAYAFRNRGDYHGVWWLRAEKAETLVDDLIELGRRRCRTSRAATTARPLRARHWP